MESSEIRRSRAVVEFSRPEVSYVVPMTEPMAEVDVVTMLNAARGGFEVALGLRFTRASADEVACEVPVGPSLHQPYGLVHGGVYASIIETLASVGAALFAMPNGQTAVGLENTTSFLRAVRTGTLRGLARPLQRGRTTQVWEVEVRGDDGKLAATGRVRMLCLAPGAQVAGQTVALKSG
jgi:1,4-dihydroxy-2-naphthoyl-CoA hydrolase